MYYPYFRGRQSELLALRATASKLAKKKKVVPIIEPVMAKMGALKNFLESVNPKLPHVVITNPAVGQIAGQAPLVEALIDPFLARLGNQLVPGLHIGPMTTPTEISMFLSKYGKKETTLVFDRPNQSALQLVIAKILAAPIKPIAVFVNGKVNPSLIHALGGLRKVILQDGFIPQARNADYPTLDFFSDLHRTYKASGYHGFGDFNVIGDAFNPGGGPARAVAIHLTELNQNQEIDTNHFVSNRTTGIVDPAGKFLEALGKLVTHVRARPQSFTFSQARAEFEGHHGNQHFPGLPTVKRLSIQHHLELMESIV